MRMQIYALGLVFVCASGLAGPAAPARSAPLDRPFVVAQAMIPPTGMGAQDMTMAAQDMAEEERMRRRFPQAVRVGDLIGLPVLDDDSRTLGHVRQVVRTPAGQNQADRCLWRLPRLRHATGRRADRGGGNFRPSARLARYAAEGLCRRADVAGHRRYGRSERRQHSHRVGAPLSDGCPITTL